MESSPPVEVPLEAGLAADRARRPLVWLLWLTSLATATGTFVYTYPSTLLMIRQAMIWTHDLSGDLLIGVAVVYLVLHLQRTWRMWRRVLSRWSGYVAVLILAVSAGTGIYGQVYGLEAQSLVWRGHVVGSIAWVVLGSFHGAVGLRRKLKADRG